MKDGFILFDEEQQVNFNSPAPDLFNIVYQLPTEDGLLGAERLQRLAGLGVRRVAAPAAIETDRLSALTNHCRAAGLTVSAVSAAHTGERPLSETVTAALQSASDCGVSLVRVQTPVLNGLNNRDAVERTLEQLRALENTIASSGTPEIPVGLEPEAGGAMSMVGARDVFHELDSDRLGMSINPATITPGPERFSPPSVSGDMLRYNLRRFLTCYFFAGYRDDDSACNLWNGQNDLISIIFTMHFSRDVPPEHIIVQDPAIERLLDGDDSDLFYVKNMLSALAEYSYGHPGLKSGERNLANVTDRVAWGRAELMPDQDFPVGAPVTYTLRITVGPGGVAPGGEIRIQHPHLWKAGRMQTVFPERDGYVSVRSSSEKAELMLFARPYALAELVIGVASGELKENDTLDVCMGDISAGGPGILSNKDMADLAFTIAVRRSVNNKLLAIEDRPVLRVTNGPAARLNVIAPSIVTPGSELSLGIRADDQTGYPCMAPGRFAYAGRAELFIETDDGTVRPLPDKAVNMTKEDAGAVRKILKSDPPALQSAEVCRIVVRDAENGLQGRSNPVSCRETPDRRLYWGEIHPHSNESDGRLSIDFLFRYARDYAGLDFAASGDHSMAWDAKKWSINKEYTARYHEDHRFVTLLGTEFSKPAPYGDRNAYFKTLDVPPLQGHAIEDIWDWVAEHGGLLIPHQLAAPPMAIDWRYHDPRVERLVEVISCHGNFEKPDAVHGYSSRHGLKKGALTGGAFYQDALARGYRLGVIGSSDTHDTHTGHTPYEAWRSTPLAAVWATELTRESIFQAMWDRRCYATSGARIILEKTVNGAPMGSEISRTAGQDPPVRVRVSVTGTAEIATVDIVRNNADVHTVTPKSESVSFEYLDKTADECGAPEVYYYVRVTQSDGEMAWSSPVWIAMKTTKSNVRERT